MENETITITPAPKMSPSVAKAVVAVTRGIKGKLGKGGYNEHGKYKFVSVDDFYEFVGPLMAEAGLFTLAHLTRSEVFEIVKEEYGKEKRTSQLNMEFDLFLVAEDGDMYGPVTREVTVIAAGPQAYASAESFVTKYFVRNLFKVPTGEPDADDDDKDGSLPAKDGKKADKKAAPAERNTDAKLKPVIAFVDQVNAFLDEKGDDAEALAAYESDAANNARFRRIRVGEFDHVPAARELMLRINKIYADASPEPAESAEPEA